MLSRKCWLRFRAINGDGGSFFFKSIIKFTTKATAAQEAQSLRNTDMVDYLINSLGFSKDAAISALSKVPNSRPSLVKAEAVVNYLGALGFSKTHIRNMVSGYPNLLCSMVDKTLAPKFKFFLELGLSWEDLCKVIIACRFGRGIGLDTSIKPRVLYVRQLVGTNDNVVKVLQRCPRVLGGLDVEIVESNLKLLRNCGISDDNILRLIVRKPSALFVSKCLEDILHRVENVLGIPRNSAMFGYGVEVLSSLNRSTFDEKFGVFRSFGWSEAEVLIMLRAQPLIFTSSAPRIRKVVDYFMNELGYSADYLASHPAFLTFSIEKRVKPRNEVIRILNERKLTKRRAMLFTVLHLSESKFFRDYVLPYKDILPDMYDAYTSKAEISKIKQ